MRLFGGENNLFEIGDRVQIASQIWDYDQVEYITGLTGNVSLTGLPAEMVAVLLDDGRQFLCLPQELDFYIDAPMV